MAGDRGAAGGRVRSGSGTPPRHRRSVAGNGPRPTQPGVARHAAGNDRDVEARRTAHVGPAGAPCLTRSEERRQRRITMAGREKAMKPEDITRMFVDRSNSGDAEGVAALYEDHAVMGYPPGGQTVGRAAIQALWERCSRPGHTSSRKSRCRRSSAAISHSHRPPVETVPALAPKWSAASRTVPGCVCLTCLSSPRLNRRRVVVVLHVWAIPDIYQTKSMSARHCSARFAQVPLERHRWPRPVPIPTRPDGGPNVFEHAYGETSMTRAVGRSR
jgi:hypothetical protein